MGVTDTTLIHVVDAEGNSWIGTYAKFARANAECPELLEDVQMLARGWGLTIGGGAEPFFTISRWSR